MANTDGWLGADFDFGLEKLLRLIENEGNFDAFSKKYFASDAAAFDVLNNIIRFGEDENKDLFDRKEKPLRVFPDQMPGSVFREKRELSRDVQIPFQLKDVLKTAGDNLYEKLIRDEILVFERDSKLRVKDVSDRIKEKVEKFFSGKVKEGGFGNFCKMPKTLLEIRDRSKYI